MKFFFLHSSEAPGTLGKMKSRNLLLSDEFRVEVMGIRAQGRTARWCLSHKSWHPFRWSSSFTCCQKGFELGFVCWETSSEVFSMRSSVGHTFPSAGLVHTTSSSPTFQDMNSLHSQLMPSTSNTEFLFLIRRKAPIVEWRYQIQRLKDINKENGNTLAVVFIHTFLWASEIHWWLDILKVNIFTIVEKQTIFLNPLSLSSSLPGLGH